MCVLPLAAKEKSFDKEQFKRASIRFDEVTGTCDPKAILLLADSLHKVGRKTDNYAVSLLYYEAMALHYYYAEGSEEEKVKNVVANYEKGMQEAESYGSESHYWKFYHAKVISQLTINSMDCIDQVEKMQQEVSEKHSDYGMMRVYHTLSFIYYYRDDMMMAVDVLRKAARIGEEKLATEEDEKIATALYDLIYSSLADYLYQLKMYDEALEMTDKMENFLQTSTIFKDDVRQWRMREVYAMRANIHFDRWQYDEFDKEIALLKADPTYSSYIMSPDKLQLRFYTLLREGREAEIQKLMTGLDDFETHYYRHLYFKYHNMMRQAIQEDEICRHYLDSTKYSMHAQDLASIDAKMGNVQLREEKLRLENQQFRIKAWATGGIMLVIVLSISTLLFRHRRHAKQLLEKNEQLSIARDEAEEQRAEAEHQKGIAEEQRAEAENQRTIAEEQRTLAVKAQQVAEHANEMKGQFILNMMHEIRTPLNHIKGFSTIIADPNMHGEKEMMQEASTQISNSTNHLTHLLDDILQLGKYDGMTDVEKADVSIVELLLTAMMNSPQSDPSKVEMIPAIEDADPGLTIRTNMDMAQKALAALINNAVKFTKEGHIKLGIETEREDVVKLYVEDTGPGIPAGKEEYIFERFTKLDEFVPGTGLGLSLADVIAKGLGGRIFVDTQYAGPGARFVMELPRN